MDWAKSLSDQQSTSSYCVLTGGSLISRKSKKQKAKLDSKNKWRGQVSDNGISHM